MDTPHVAPRQRRWWLLAIAVAVSSLLILHGAATTHASTVCPAGVSMQIVAHPDDDLLFQNPDVLHDIRSGRCVRTVYVTAGERENMGRVHAREAGIEAAYAQMAGVPNGWTTTDAGVAGHPMALVTLAGRPNVSLVFMRLPQGYWGDRTRLRDREIQSERGDMSTPVTLAAGIRASYGQIRGAADAWPLAGLGGSSESMVLPALAGRRNALPGSMPLPTAFWRAAISPANETIENLWVGKVSRIHAVDRSSAYTKQELVSTLWTLMTAFQPDTIRTGDYLGTFGDGDHDDHHAAAYFARSAQLSYATAHTFTGYLDYTTEQDRQNLFGGDLRAKAAAFYAYLAFDPAPCGSPPDCGTNDYSQWLKRQYIVGVGDARVRDRRSSPRVAGPRWSTLARIPEGPS